MAKTRFYKEWFDPKLRENFRLIIIPVDSNQSNWDKETYEEIKESTLSVPHGFKAAFDELPQGMIDTPTMTLSLNTKYLPDKLKQYILSTTSVDYYGVPLTNTWLLMRDKGTNKNQWFTKFAGVQRKLPGPELIIHKGFKYETVGKGYITAEALNTITFISQSSELKINDLLLINEGNTFNKMQRLVISCSSSQATLALNFESPTGSVSEPITVYRLHKKSATIKITLLDIGRAILEHIHPAIISEIGDLKSVDNTDPNDPITSRNIAFIEASYIKSFVSGNKALIQKPVVFDSKGEEKFVSVILPRLSYLFDLIKNFQILIIEGFLHSTNITVEYTRYPHYNWKWFKSDGITHLDPSEIRFISTCKTELDSMKYDGWIGDKKNNEASIFNYNNLYDFFEDVAENFLSKIHFHNDITCEIGQQATGILTYNFSRLKETISTRSNSERTLNLLKAIDDDIKIPIGASIIRGGQSSIDSAFIKENDDDEFLVEDTGILSETVCDAKIMFHNNSSLLTKNMYESDENNI